MHARYCITIVLFNCKIILFYSASITIDDSGATPVMGQSYNLTCTVNGTTVATYQWRKNWSVIPNESGSTLAFSPLRLPDAGWYSCGVGAALLSSDVIITLQSQ